MANLFDFKLVFTEIPAILHYLPTTIWLTLAALLIGLVLGLIIALIRINNIPVLKQLSIAFVSVIRGTPIIVQLYISYFGIPIALKYINYYNGTNYDVNAIPGIVFAMAALGLNQAAFDSETIRSSIQSVEPGQIDAARSMGMTGFQVLRRVIIPQAGSVALLPLGNSVISLIKGTSVVGYIAVQDLTKMGDIIRSRTYEAFFPLIVVTLIYFILFWFVARLIEFAIRKINPRNRTPEQIMKGVDLP